MGAEERQEQLRLSARIHSGRERLGREAGAMHGLKKTEKKLLLRFERKRRKTDVNLRSLLANAKRVLKHAVNMGTILFKQRHHLKEEKLRRSRSERGRWLWNLKAVRVKGASNMKKASQGKVELRKKLQQEAKNLKLREHEILVAGLKQLKQMEKVEKLERKKMHKA